MNTQFTSIKDIAAQVYSHPLMKDVSFERIVRDSIELMQIVGCPVLFDDKEAVIDIHNYTGRVPCDYYDVKQVKLYSTHKGIAELPERTVNKGKLNDLEYQLRVELAKDNPDVDTVKKLNAEIIRAKSELDSTSLRLVTTPGEQHDKMLVQKTGTFMYDHNKDFSYQIKGDYIYVGIDECKVKMAYQAIMTDDDGYPMIVNNASFIRALVSYIKKNYFTILVECGQMQFPILHNAQQEYSYNVAQASNDMIDSSPEKMAVVSRYLNSMLSTPDMNMVGYDGLNKTHDMNLHR